MWTWGPCFAQLAVQPLSTLWSPRSQSVRVDTDLDLGTRQLTIGHLAIHGAIQRGDAIRIVTYSAGLEFHPDGGPSMYVAAPRQGWVLALATNTAYEATGSLALSLTVMILDDEDPRDVNGTFTLNGPLSARYEPLTNASTWGATRTGEAGPPCEWSTRTATPT